MFKRFTPYLLFLFIFFGFEFIWQKPEWFYFSAALLVVLAAAFFYRQIKKQDASLISFLTPLLIFLMASLVLTLFIEQWWTRRLFAVLIAGAIVLFHHYLFKKKEAASVVGGVAKDLTGVQLDNTLRIVNIFSVFLITAGLSAVRIYLEVRLWQLSLLFGTVIFLMNHQFFTKRAVTEKDKAWGLAMAVSLVLAEFFMIVNFWPVSFYVRAIIVSSLYYLMLELSRFTQFKGEKAVWRLIIIAVFIWLVILTTTAWR